MTDHDELPDDPDDETPIPMPPVRSRVTYDYTHGDIATAVNRAMDLLRPILDEDIYKNMPRAQWDLPDVLMLLEQFGNRVAVHGYKVGKLVWQTDILPHVDEDFIGKLLKKD